MKVTTKSTHCWSCGKPIKWGITAAGKPIPLDPDPVPNGNLAIGPGDPAKVRVLLDDEEPVRASEWRGVTHFVTCPTANLHRNRKASS